MPKFFPYPEVVEERYGLRTPEDFYFVLPSDGSIFIGFWGPKDIPQPTLAELEAWAATPEGKASLLARKKADLLPLMEGLGGHLKKQQEAAALATAMENAQDGLEVMTLFENFLDENYAELSRRN